MQHPVTLRLTRLLIAEIPADRCVIVDAASIEEVRALAAGANVQHGKGNTQADYCNIIKRMMDLGDTYMKNCFEPDISKIAASIGAARTAVMRGYNDYVGTAEKPVPTLSSVCKEKRDAAIMEQHKAGLSSHKIAALFKMSQKTVSNVIDDLSKKPESGKLLTPNNVVLPLANTEDRSETRVDADEFVDDFLSEYDDYISLAEVGKAHLPLAFTTGIAQCPAVELKRPSLLCGQTPHMDNRTAPRTVC